MGSFSWTRAETTTKRSNLTYGDKYKILVPEEFGGGYIKDIYYDYGKIFELQTDHKFSKKTESGYFTYVDGNEIPHSFDSTADLYGVLAYWNGVEGMTFAGGVDGHSYPSTMIDILQRGLTTEQDNRCKGIAIGCGKETIDRLQYPLKLVSLSYKGTYEECKGRSYNDPNQGFGKFTWDCKDYDEIFSELYALEPDVDPPAPAPEASSKMLDSDDAIAAVKFKLGLFKETHAEGALHEALMDIVNLIDSACRSTE